ncbi:protein kinase domain-containing protein [Sorangium sp. So ce1389]|uniref:serine/threonine-protein kinase n=1 Tax=Sorangium sp. So ce1389 TaxID=3133336 RepID=UPI003F638243
MSMPGDLPLQVGDVLKEKYRVVRVLGAGGMGAVLEAHHLVLDQRVAIKLVLPEAAKRSGSVQRFLREARAASSLRSEHVARVLDVDTLDGGLPYLVMDLLEGADLSVRLRSEGRLPIEEACEIGVQICEALSEAHARGIVHRDIKPGNLFIARRTDGSPLVKVLDFGIAKLLGPVDELGADSLTSQNAMVGSPLYMSPEQMRASRAVDTRSDLWSLGVALYQALSGKLPFEAETFGALILLVMQERPAPLSSLRAEVPEALSHAIMRCLERSPEERWQDVAQLAAALAPFAPARARPLVERAQATLAVRGHGSRPSALPGQAPAASPAGAADTPRVSATLPAAELVCSAATPPVSSTRPAGVSTPPAGVATGAPAAGSGRPIEIGRATELAAHPGPLSGSGPTMTHTAAPWSGSQPPAGRALPRWLRLTGGAAAVAGLIVAALLWARQRPAVEAEDAPAAGAPAAGGSLRAHDPLQAQPAPSLSPEPPAPDLLPAPRAPEEATPAGALATATASAAAPVDRPAGSLAAAPAARPAARPTATAPPRRGPAAAPAPRTDAPAAAPGPAAGSAPTTGAPADASVPNYGGRK